MPTSPVSGAIEKQALNYPGAEVSMSNLNLKQAKNEGETLHKKVYTVIKSSDSVIGG
jgi:hypothetical protein